MTRSQARAAGLKSWFTGKPCRRGHIAERKGNGNCVQCLAEYFKGTEFKTKNRRRVAAYHEGRKGDPGYAERERTRKRLLMQRRRLDPAVREYNRQYQRDHAEQVNQKTARRYARRLAGFVEDVPLSYLFERDKGCCQLCGDALSASTKYPHPKTATQDHIIPLSKGGTHERKNLQLACFDCNRRKSNRDTGQQMLKVG